VAYIVNLQYRFECVDLILCISVVAVACFNDDELYNQNIRV